MPVNSRGSLREWVSRGRYSIFNSGIVRCLVVLNLIALHVFCLLRNARNEKIYKRVTKVQPGRRYGQISSPSRIHRTAEKSSHDYYKLIEARSGLPPFETCIGYIYNLAYWYNWYLLAKHLTIMLVQSDLLPNLGFLDCLLFGRFMINSRVIDVANTCACFLIIIQLFWLHILGSVTSDIQLPCIEFLLKKPDEVLHWNGLESRERKFSQSTSRHMPGDRHHHHHHHRYHRNHHHHHHRHHEQEDQGQLHSSIFELRNPFVVSATGPISWTFQLRPNRTHRAWSRLAEKVLNFNKVFLPSFVIIIVIFVRMCLPLIITKQGFELNYRYCLRWLKSDHPKRHNSTSSLVDESWARDVLCKLIDPVQDGRDLALINSQPENNRERSFRSRAAATFWMPLSDFVPLNYYHAVRGLMDLFDTVFLYFESALTMSSAGFVALVAAEDLIQYSSQVNKRLKRHIKILRVFSSFNQHEWNQNLQADFTIRRSQNSTANFNQTNRVLMSHPREPKTLQDSSVDIQAQIADLFMYMRNYNKYSQYQATYFITLWLSYSALVTSWIFLPGNESPKLEWYILHCFATCYLFLFMAQYAEVKRSFCQIYKLICIAMALDGDYELSKITWMSLLQFYTPIPLHCYTFITKIELDFMFGLKLVAWLASALIVAASFFNVYNLE